MKKLAYILTTLVMLLQSCVKDVEIKIPGSVDKVVIEGSIEPGMPPIIFITRNKPYFGTSNFSSFNALLIHGATVTVSNGTYTATLFEICASSVPDSLMPVLSAITGLDSTTLASIDFCLYTTFDSNIFGIEGKSYTLNVSAEGKSLYSKTTIPFPSKLDSIWYKNEGTYTDRGFCWARLKDPDTLGNAYRWYAKRLGQDFSFTAPIGSTFEDKFINGQSFEFAYNRSHTAGEDPNSAYSGYYVPGDTIVVKFTSIGKDEYQFYRTYETQVVNNGNPFAAPTPIRSNIKGDGGLGIWCGFGIYYDTTIAR